MLRETLTAGILSMVCVEHVQTAAKRAIPQPMVSPASLPLCSQENLSAREENSIDFCKLRGL